MHSARSGTSSGKRARSSAGSLASTRSLTCEPLEERRMMTGDGLAFEPIGVPYVVTTSHDEVAYPLAGSSSPGGFSPTQLRHAYGFDQIFFEGGTIVGDGTGQTIAIVNAYHTPNAAADLAAFNAYFGLPAPPSFVQVNQTGGTAFPGTSSGWALETALDVQWAHAFAPGASILLVEANSANFSDLMTAVDYARSQSGVSVVSMSWGTSGEFSNETNYDFHFTTPANHAGVAFFAAAGNSGGPGGYPAYSANVVAVGGTSLTLNASNNIATEVAWSGSGGGISQYQSQPIWQNGVVTQTATQRGMPDVAFNANPSTGVPVYDTFNNSASTPWSKVAGTSFATPSWAALVAIADQGRTLAGLPVLDSPALLSMLYAMPSTNFNDIVSGSSTGASPQAAGPGYDLVTGLGTPKAQLVAASLVGVSTVSGTVFHDQNGDGTPSGEPGLSGWRVYADLNENAAYDPTAVNQYSNNVAQTISTVGTSTINSDITLSGLAGDILDVNVTLNLNHTNVGDLVVTLIAPDNSEHILVNHAGGTGDNFANTTFDDSAATPISLGSAPFSGSYRPAESLAALFAKNPNGTWRLRVQDTAIFNGGSLNSWSLQITSGDLSTLTGANGGYVLDDLPTGTYKIREVSQSPYTQTSPAVGYHTVTLASGQTLTGRNFGNELPQAGAPGAVTLLAASDTGVSSSDRITKLNNATPAAILQFQVAGTVAGATVTIEADGTPIGSAIAAGTTTIVGTNGAIVLANGVRNISARQTLPGQSPSAPSAIVTITIDTAAPVSSIVAVTPNPRTTPVDQLTINFNEPVSGLNLAGLSLSRDAGGNLLTAAQNVDTSNGLSWTLHNLSGITTPGGLYQLLLTPALSSATDVAGNVATSAGTSFTVLAGVLARSIFYNGSGFDGDDAAINAADDAAIASDKVAYRPGDGVSGADNVTSYARGINGIMVDLAANHGTLTAADFTFKMSGAGLDANSSPATWEAAPAPIGFAVRAGQGVSGSDRIEFVWADATIGNRWLQVTVEGNDAAGGFNANTGLAASDVFFFGNKIGASFLDDPEGAFKSDQLDQIATRFNQGIALSLTNAFDFNRDFTVDPIDEIIARFNQGYLLAIDVENPPAAPAAAPVAAPSSIEVPVAPVSLAPVPVVLVPVEQPTILAPLGEAGLTVSVGQAADSPRRSDSGLAFAAAFEQWRLQLLSDASAGGHVDDQLLGLLVDGRFLGRRR